MDNKNSILLIDPAFEPSNANNCNLLVKIGSKNFSYAIINCETNKVCAVYDQQECENVTSRFAESLKTDPYLTLAYQDVKVAINTANAIAVPNELFNEENVSINAKYFRENNSGNVYVDAQNHFGFNTIFSLTKTTEELLNFTDAKILHENAGLLNQAEQLNAASLILDFAVGNVNVIYLNDNRVIFQQCYEIEDVEEFNYYLLLMINLLKLERTTKIYTCGIIHENDDNYNCITKYFETIEFLTVSNHLDQEVLEDMPAHYYSSLLALSKCG